MNRRRLVVLGLATGVVMTVVLAALDGLLRDRLADVPFHAVRFAALSIVLIGAVWLGTRGRGESGS